MFTSLVTFDDMVVTSENADEHDRILGVFKRALENGVRFNIDKIQYRVNSIRYMGHIISQQG